MMQGTRNAEEASIRLLYYCIYRAPDKTDRVRFVQKLLTLELYTGLQTSRLDK
jgi:hypothetical protein